MYHTLPKRSRAAPHKIPLAQPQHAAMGDRPRRVAASQTHREPSDEEYSQDDPDDSDEPDPKPKRGRPATTGASRRGRAVPGTTAAASSAASSSTSPAASPDVLIKLFVSAMMKKTAAELKTVCAEKGLAGSGTKADLVARLAEREFPDAGVTAETVKTATVTTKRESVPVLKGNPQNWEAVATSGLASRLISESDATVLALGQVGPELDHLRSHVGAIIDHVRRKAVGVSATTALYTHFVNRMAIVVMEKMRAAGTPVDPLEFTQTLAILSLLKLSALPVKDQWDVSWPLPQKRFHEVVHGLTGYGSVPGSSTERKTGWIPLDKAMEAWGELEAAFAKPMRDLMQVPAHGTLDDDLVDFAGDSDHVAQHQVLSREGEGSPIDVMSHALLTFPFAAMVRRGGDPATRCYETNLVQASQVSQQTSDRGYTKMPVVTKLVKEYGVAYVGTLAEGSMGQQPFSVANFGNIRKGWDAASLQGAALTHGGDFGVLSFQGCGDSCRAAVNPTNGTAAIISVQRRPKGATHGVVPFLRGDPDVLSATGHVDAARLEAFKEKMARACVTWVGVTGHVPRKLNIPVLRSPDPEKPSALDPIFHRLHAAGLRRILTVVQGDFAWGRSRTVLLTASVVGRHLPAVLNAFSEQYALVRSAMRPGASHVPGPPVQDLTLEDFGPENTDEPALHGSGQSAGAGFGPVQAGPSAASAATPSGVDDVEDGMAHAEADSPASALAILLPSPAEDDAEDAGADSAPPAPLLPGGTPPLVSKLAEVVASGSLSPAGKLPAFVMGHTQELRGQNWVKDVRGVVPSTLCTTGLVLSLLAPLAASPDMLAHFDLSALTEASNGPVPAPMAGAAGQAPVLVVVEHKASKHFVQARGSAACFPRCVVAGTAAYYAAVPWKFRAQLLVQCYVVGTPYALLIMSAPTGPAASYLIYYEQGILDQLGSMYQQEHVSGFFGAFVRGLSDATLSDEELVGMLPVDLPVAVRFALASHVPLCHALAAYNPSAAPGGPAAGILPPPLPPLRAVRSFVVAEYDALKGGTDSVGRYLADANRAGSSHFHFSLATKLTIRFLDYAKVAAFRLGALFAVLLDKSRDEVDELGRNPYELRRLMREAGGVYTSAVDKLARELLERRVCLGQLDAVHLVTPAAAAAPASPGGGLGGAEREIWGAHPGALREVLRVRTQRGPASSRRSITDADFYGGFVRAASSMSMTPGNARVVVRGSYWDVRLPQLKMGLDTAPQPVTGSPAERTEGSRRTGSTRGTRILHWDLAGQGLRLCPFIEHSFAPLPGKGVCLICSVTTRKLVACVTCGEQMCGPTTSRECAAQFHSETFIGAIHEPEEGAHESVANSDADEQPAASQGAGLQFDGPGSDDDDE